VKNVLVLCHDEESMSDLSLLTPHGMNKPFQHHVACLINSGLFGHEFKMDDTPDVEKADQLFFDLGL
jgi:hypothetical protein